MIDGSKRSDWYILAGFFVFMIVVGWANGVFQ